MQLYEFDTAYLERLQAAHPETERHFIEYFSPLLLVKLRRRLGSAALVEDVRQETFFRTFRSIRGGALRQPDRLGAFVHRMCENILLESLRRDSRAQPLVDDVFETPEPRPGAESDLITAERTEMVRRVIADLREQDCSLLRAIFLEERDKDEVCRDFGVDRAYLRVLLHRAKNQFRREFLKRAGA